MTDGDHAGENRESGTGLVELMSHLGDVEKREEPADHDGGDGEHPLLRRPEACSEAGRGDHDERDRHG